MYDEPRVEVGDSLLRASKTALQRKLDRKHTINNKTDDLRLKEVGTFLWFRVSRMGLQSR